MGDQAGEWVPEFPGQRTPFPPGNVPANAFEPGNVPANATHGAYSPRKFEPLAQELLDHLLAADSTPTWVKAERYRLELLALCRTEARVQLIDEWLTAQATEQHPAGDLGNKRVGAAYHQLQRLETRAASSRMRLGLTPVSAARMGKNVAQGQAAQAQTDVALRMAAQHRAEAALRAAGWTPPAEPVHRGPDQDRDQDGDDDDDR